jgi:pimeloyl-ACP methyl ester carboxylesterase
MPDLPGFGQSPPAGDDMSMDDYARHAIDVLDQRGIDKAVLAGLSMGGYVCFAALRLFRERIGGLILLDTRETADTEEGRKGRFAMIETVEAHGGVQPVVEAMLPKMLTPSAPQEMRDRVREIMSSASPQGVIAALRAMASRPDSSPLLSSIDVPTLIVVGEQDAITPVADAERMHAAIRGSNLVKVPHAAHLACFEQGEVVNDAISTWCSDSGL